MGRIRRSLVEKLIRAADTHYFELPKGWQVFSRYRTAELFLKHPAPPAVQYGDWEQYKALAEEHPAVKLEPLRINATQPSLATRFVSQQHALIGEYRLQHQKMLKKRQLEDELEQILHLQQQQQQDLQPDAREQLLRQQQQKEQELQQLEQAELKDPPAVKMQEKQQLVADAFTKVEVKMRRELDGAGRESAAGGFLEFIQDQEEEALQAALRKLQDQHAAAS